MYYKPVGEKSENIKMMEIMDKHLTDHPTEGVKSLVLFFIARSYPVGPKRIRRLLKIMGRETLYRRKVSIRPTTSFPLVLHDIVLGYKTL